MTEERALMTSDNHGRAIDRAIEMLGIALRDEIQDERGRRAELLKGRLRNANRPALLDRVVAASRQP